MCHIEDKLRLVQIHIQSMKKVIDPLSAYVILVLLLYYYSNDGFTLHCTYHSNPHLNDLTILFVRRFNGMFQLEPPR